MQQTPGSIVYTTRIVTFLALMNLIAGIGTNLLWDYFSLREMTFFKWFVYGIFLILFTNLSYGTTVSIFGFWKSITGGDKYRITKNILSNKEFTLHNVPVAIIMPIYGEDVDSVFPRIQTMYNSIQKQKEESNFDFYILSDTQNLEKWILEETAYFELCQKLNAFGRIFYRKRKMNLNKKSGNLADFCRRWGKKYRYMIVLDADSLLTGECIIQLTKLMEENPSTGIIQTSPQIINAETYFQKIMQFSNLVHSNLFAVGANYWQLNSSPFWGHNAIIRLKPFMENCGLPSLPKLGAVGGRILSHDTIEAALIRKAGYSVWFAYDLKGSYEESPPNVIDSLKRDQRWCQGNLQHFWFLFAKGLKFTSRIHILLGIFSYASSLLWFMFLVCTVFIYIEDLQFYRLALGPEKWKFFWNFIYFNKALKLQIFSITILFLPRILTLLYVLIKTEYKKYSQNLAIFLVNYFFEFGFSIIQAPILMYMHSKFIMLTLIGVKIEWKSQNRSANNTPSFIEILNTFYILSILGILIGIYFYFQVFGLFYWMLPIWGSWAISPLFIYFISNKDSKNKLLFQNSKALSDIELKNLDIEIKSKHKEITEEKNIDIDSLFLISVDPYYNSLHCFLQKTTHHLPEKRIKHGEYLIELLLKKGPSSLTSQDLQIILYNSIFMKKLYSKFWDSSESDLNSWWNKNFVKYKMGLFI
ncbi:MAG TPA: glucans biosynthesis glucosyltransferase MdoH [Leptospiraceae bacterium]|nr:glucans biosynthesis glucosyltransferase MdoH [Leptospiraceae bacterium]HMW06215.1 glucans biosynthesis glucosyltransferase MdoH [Leptospiraceae bacterium]HMX34292.1 glucans biosynthesis glucosyltransferase MdoH [Leptospiraceae bacterium]HMY31677.1 glucans biosynthesis glucosyltransferase MdoH [Leptospiraceae bacterium]HMZ65656.1 glucans biosynthesis glucosyltransferase MdoH [Leptospiraceae bacterium]